jgi:hypothetical protein
MNLKPFTELEKSIGGRPRKEHPKVRLSFYVSQPEADRLKALSEQQSCPLSQIVRLILQYHLSNNDSSS